MKDVEIKEEKKETKKKVTKKAEKKSENSNPVLVAFMEKRNEMRKKSGLPMAYSEEEINSHK